MGNFSNIAKKCQYMRVWIRKELRRPGASLAGVLRRRNLLRLFAAQLADDDIPLDLTGTFINLVDLGVAH
jgi:hypothetical protein